MRWPLLSLVIASLVCILYGMKERDWNLPHINQGGYAMTSFTLCSFALSLILSFRIKMVTGRRWDCFGCRWCLGALALHGCTCHGRLPTATAGWAKAWDHVLGTASPALLLAGL